MWDFQLNNRITQQLYEDCLLFDQVEILNISCKDGRELSLNISLKEILIVNIVIETTVIDDKINKVSRY